MSGMAPSSAMISEPTATCPVGVQPARSRARTTSAPMMRAVTVQLRPIAAVAINGLVHNVTISTSDTINAITPAISENAPTPPTNSGCARATSAARSMLRGSSAHTISASSVISSEPGKTFHKSLPSPIQRIRVSFVHERSGSGTRNGIGVASGASGPGRIHSPRSPSSAPSSTRRPPPMCSDRPSIFADSLIWTAPPKCARSPVTRPAMFRFPPNTATSPSTTLPRSSDTSPPKTARSPRSVSLLRRTKLSPNIARSPRQMRRSSAKSSAVARGVTVGAGGVAVCATTGCVHAMTATAVIAAKTSFEFMTPSKNQARHRRTTQHHRPRRP